MTFPNFTEKLEVKLEPNDQQAVDHSQNHNNLDSDNLLEHLDDIMGDVINEDDDLGNNFQFHIKINYYIIIVFFVK